MGPGLREDGSQPVRLKFGPGRMLLSATRLALDAAAEAFLPRHCISCGSVLSTTTVIDLCPACSLASIFCGHEVCARCGAPLASPESCICRQAFEWTVDTARSAFIWGGPPRAMVLSLKYSRKWELARPMAAAMAAVWAASGMEVPDLVTSVPVLGRRFLSRGYNQAALLASAFSRAVGLPADNFILVRPGTGKSTRGLGADERRALAVGSFKVRNGRNVNGHRILLIDDVITTGATVSDCARALKSAGASRVDVLTFARSVHGA